MIHPPWSAFCIKETPKDLPTRKSSQAKRCDKLLGLFGQRIAFVEEDDLERDELFLSLSQLSSNYESDDIPILLYPASHADKMAIHYEKTYNLWILNMQYFDSYLEYIERMLKRYKTKTSNGSTAFPPGNK